MSPRTSSVVREPASRNPQTALEEGLNFHAHAHRFAFYPPAPHVSGTTSFLLASALCRSPCLATRRRRRHAMRPNDFCHPNELRAPAPRRVPGSVRHFRSGDPARPLRDRAALTGGPEVFTTSETASADTPFDTGSRALLPHGLETRAWAFSSHGVEVRSSLWHPRRRPSLIFRLARLRVRCVLTGCPSLEGVIRVGRCDAGQDRRSRCLVKSLASFRSRTPSIGRDPS